jgi:hypothetical protein
MVQYTSGGSPLSLPGATAPTRYAGGTTSGAPVSGTFKTGDFVIDETGVVWICTAAGSPGSWVNAGAGAGPGMTLLAATPVAGYTLVDSTGTIISWTAPNDGLLHRVMLFLVMHVTSTETGGNIQFSADFPDGQNSTVSPIVAGKGAGVQYPAFPYFFLVQAGTTVVLSQSTALTAGASVLWAELWGS